MSLWKNKGSWKSGWLDKIQSKTRLQSVNYFFFYQNNIVLIYKKNKVDLVTQLKPMARALGQVDHRAGFKKLF
jgi:hypothetical protein